MKYCNDCEHVLPYELFSKKGNGYNFICKKCNSARSMRKKCEKYGTDDYNKATKCQRYGLTIDELEKLLRTVECIICGDDITGKQCIDHNHDTGEIRGALCSNCNSGLGMFNDDVETLAKAIQYLTKNGSYAVQ